MNNQEQSLLNDINLIEDLGEKMQLSSEGHNDIEGYQIFTPDFIVDDMIKMIGLHNIVDIDKTILEPASGDGAFTVRILEMRLKNLKSDEYTLLNALNSLSTIYAIEMDRDLLIRQRNNLYSTFLLYLKKTNQVLTNHVCQLIKQIIVSNIIWGETNIREEYAKSNIVGWYLPLPMLSDKKHKDMPNYPKAEPIKFAKWTIYNDLTYLYEYEAAEFDNSIDESQLGGLFNEW